MTAKERCLCGEVVPPDGELVVSYGGGVNTVAVLLALHDHGVRPRAIVMADPGSERAATVAYRDNVMAPWLAAVGFPPVVVVNRRDEGAFRPRAWRLETLREECLRMGNLPSVAYGLKKCSAKYKGEPQRWWVERQPWARAAWSAGRRVIRVIGYDRDEERRVLKSKGVSWAPQIEMARFASWHPLYDLGFHREDCEDLIAEHGLPSPGKSACTYCPNNTLEEWEQLRQDEPERFAEAVEMSSRARVESPNVVGLMRCNAQGKRQLHVWADGGYGPSSGGHEPEQDCECAT